MPFNDKELERLSQTIINKAVGKVALYKPERLTDRLRQMVMKKRTK